MTKKLISIVTPTYNEIDNIELLLNRIRDVIAPLDRYDFEMRQDLAELKDRLHQSRSFPPEDPVFVQNQDVCVIV